MDKVEIIALSIVVILVIFIVYLVLTNYVFTGSSSNGSHGFGVAIDTGGGGCVSSSGNCPQNGSAGPGQYLTH